MLVYLIYVFYILDAVEDARKAKDKHGEPFPGWLAFVQLVFNFILIAFSGFFLYKEHEQFQKMFAKDKGKNKLIKSFYKYYSDFWNYPDVIPPVLIILVIIADTLTNDERRPHMDEFRITL